MSLEGKPWRQKGGLRQKGPWAREGGPERRKGSLGARREGAWALEGSAPEEGLGASRRGLEAGREALAEPEGRPLRWRRGLGASRGPGREVEIWAPEGARRAAEEALPPFGLFFTFWKVKA